MKTETRKRLGEFFDAVAVTILAIDAFFAVLALGLGIALVVVGAATTLALDLGVALTALVIGVAVTLGVISGVALAVVAEHKKKVSEK